MRQVADPSGVLKEVYGFDGFRGEQSDIISSVLKGEDGLAVMTTGGGKSLCYQVPALCVDGTAIVISPLISLMKDQVDALRKRGVSAGYVNSSLSPDESVQVMNTFRDGKYKIFYVSPERLATEDFRESLSGINISFFAIDEAHCISTWGHDFRLSYTNISKVINDIGDIRGSRVPRFAYTATATPYIREDICRQLDLVDPFVSIGKFDRKNIQFNVLHSNNKVGVIYDLIQRHRGEPTIIYSATIKAGTDLTNTLQGMGVSAEMYHGHLPSETKNKIQEDFLNNNIQVLVATNAFGMGVDKPDVRNVIHYHMPGSIENYYQEAGRAGRDGEQSYAYMVYNSNDRNLQEFFINATFPEPKNIASVQHFLKTIYQDMPISLTYERIGQICSEHVLPFQVKGILKVLEDQGVISTFNSEMLDDEVGIEVIDGDKDVDLSKLGDRRRIVTENLNLMEKLCLTKLCRRRYLLKYFGETHPHDNCGSCDSCIKQSREHSRFSVENIPDKVIEHILQGVKVSGDRASINRVSEILLGVNNSSMRRMGVLDKAYFGSLKSWSKTSTALLISQVKNHGLIQENLSSGSLSLTDDGLAVLEKRKSIAIVSRREFNFSEANSTALDPHNPNTQSDRGVSPKADGINGTQRAPIDTGLYDKLISLRKEIAREINKPVFFVMSDSVIKGIAKQPPVKKEELLALGLPESRVSQFGSKIMSVLDGHEMSHTKESKGMSIG